MREEKQRAEEARRRKEAREETMKKNRRRRREEDETKSKEGNREGERHASPYLSLSIRLCVIESHSQTSSHSSSFGMFLEWKFGLEQV